MLVAEVEIKPRLQNEMLCCKTFAGIRYIAFMILQLAYVYSQKQAYVYIYAT